MKYEFEDSAKRCEPMPEGLTLEEQMVYQILAALTVRYRAGAISAELAVKERRMADAAYDKAVQDGRLVDWHVQLTKRIERAMSAYRLNRTLENADRLVDTIDGLYRGNIE